MLEPILKMVEEEKVLKISLDSSQEEIKTHADNENFKKRG